MTHSDLDELLNAVFPFAQRMLVKHGEFYPFGATMDLRGEVTAVTGTTGNESPTSTEVIAVLVEAFREQARRDEIRASAICMDVRAVPPGKTAAVDAICARLEHATGDAVEVFLPYVNRGIGDIVYGEMFAARGTHEVFKDAGSV